MDTAKPWVSGAALAVTVGVVYLACAIAVMLFPDGTLAFFNTWAHSLSGGRK
jgi:hypothetical protein